MFVIECLSPAPPVCPLQFFSCLWLLVSQAHHQLLLLVKCSPTAEIGLGSEPLGCLAELSLSPIHVIEYSLQLWLPQLTLVFWSFCPVSVTNSVCAESLYL